MGINLGDPIFRGMYHGKKAHDDDFQEVLQRAVDAGCIKLMVTGSDLKESQKAVKLAQDYRKASPLSCSSTRSNSVSILSAQLIYVHSWSLLRYNRGPSMLCESL